MLRGGCATLLATVVCLLAACGGSAEPTPTPTPSPYPFPTVTPFAAELSARIADIQKKVSEIRGLPVAPIDEQGVVSAESLQQNSLNQYEGLLPEEERDTESSITALRMLGLVPGDFVAEEYFSQSAQDIAGLYFFKENRLVLIGDANEQLSKLDELVIAHELTHSMQDGAFDLERLYAQWTEAPQDKDGYTDYANMIRCLIEGDATFTEFKYAEEVFGDDWRDQVQAELPDGAAEGDLPGFFERASSFDYNECYNFVSNLYEDGGWAAVNAAYELPPSTAEQVIDFEKFEQRQVANRLPPPDLSVQLQDWKEIDSSQFGAFDVYNYVLTLTENDLAAANAAFGWGSGWIRLYAENEDNNRIALQLFLSFDSTDDLIEFLFAFGVVLASYGVDPNSLQPGATISWTSSTDFGHFGTISVDEVLAQAEIHIATDQEALDASNVPTPTPTKDD